MLLALSSCQRGAFSCGNQQLDLYLQKQAGQDLKKRAPVPFVITPDHKTIAGFYTLSQYAVDVGEFRAKGLGEGLLMDALYRALQSSEQIASAAIIVDAKTAQRLRSIRSIDSSNFQRLKRRLFSPMNNCQVVLWVRISFT